MNADLQTRQILKSTRDLGTITRAQVAAVLGVSMPTATALIQGLIEQGILIQKGFEQSAGGRPAALFALNPDHIYAIGVECSLMGIEALITDVNGRIHSRRRVQPATAPTPDRLMQALYDVVGEVLSQHRDKPLAGIGVGISGLVDQKNGVCVRFPRTEGCNNVPVAKLLREKFSLPVYVENDVQAATLAYLRFGAGKGVRNFLYLHIGHGIRLGIVADGKLYEGATGKAGEVGHVVVVPEGPVCYCGNYGCLESVAGPSAVVDQARSAIDKGVESSLLSLAGGREENVSFRSILEAARQRDRLSVNLIEKAGNHIGQVLANLANVLEPELLIAGAIEPELLKPLIDVITTKFRMAAMPGARDRVRIELSAFEGFPCALGAGTLVLERIFEPPSADNSDTEVKSH